MRWPSLSVTTRPGKTDSCTEASAEPPPEEEGDAGTGSVGRVMLLPSESERVMELPSARPLNSCSPFMSPMAALPSPALAAMVTLPSRVMSALASPKPLPMPAPPGIVSPVSLSTSDTPPVAFTVGAPLSLLLMVIWLPLPSLSFFAPYPPPMPAAFEPPRASLMVTLPSMVTSPTPSAPPPIPAP